MDPKDAAEDGTFEQQCALRDNESYSQLKKLLDIDNFIDYMLINQ